MAGQVLHRRGEVIGRVDVAEHARGAGCRAGGRGPARWPRCGGRHRAGRCRRARAGAIVRHQRVAAIANFPNGPNIAAGHCRRPGEFVVVIDAGVRTGHDRPGTAIPVFNQCLRGAVISQIVANGPDIVAGQRGHRSELVVVSDARVRAGRDRPGTTVPVFHQRLAIAGGVHILPHGPDIVAGPRRHPSEPVVAGPDVRAWDDRPGRAVPMFQQRLRGAAAIRIVPDGPDIVAGHCRNATELGVVVDVGIRAGDDRPGRAVPVFHQRLLGGGTRIVPDGPGIIAGYCRHPGEPVVADAGIRAGIDRPGRAVPVFHQR